MNFRTDMADERLEIHRSNIRNKEINGIIFNNKKINDNLSENIVTIVNDEGSKLIGKAKGKYITLEIKNIEMINKKEIEEIEKELVVLLKEFVRNNKSILVVGLGNAETTADSLGPKVVQNLKITRHLFKYLPELVEREEVELSAIAPGVLGTTGIETKDIISGIVEKIKPGCIIVIDAIISNNITRILKTIQISNTGIVPGSGVGNKRKEISEETIGIPVISIGVPTVVEASTIVENVFDKLKIKNKSSQIETALNSINSNVIVMPKDTDSIIDTLKSIIANSINSI